MDTILLFRKSSMRAFSETWAILASITALLIVALLTIGTTALATTTWNEAESVTFGSGVAGTSNQWTDVWSVSCPTAGNCTAVGEFTNTSGGVEGFTIRSTNGVWEQAQPVTFGSGVASVGAFATSMTKSVSCSSTSFCVAVGSVRNATGGVEAFSTTFSNGSWSTATPAIFGSGVQHDPRYATFNSVSCPATGSCVAVGQFKDSSGKSQAFTMTMSSGSWSQATPVVFAAGVNVLRPNGMTGLRSVSCVSPGNCIAGGQYDTASTTSEAFTMTMTNGSWAQATPIEFPPGTQNSSRESDVSQVSCASVGNCIVSGGVYAVTGAYKGFAVIATNGVWGTPQFVVFDSNLQVAAGYSNIYSASCSSAGNCVAVGEFENIPFGENEAFTMTMTNGTWGAPTPVGFDAGVQWQSRQGYLKSVSCSTDGNCTAAGQFWDRDYKRPAFTVSMTNGVWETAIPVAFPLGLQNPSPYTRVSSVSCASSGNCVVGGYFLGNPGSNNYFGLLVSSVNNTISTSPTTPTTPNAGGGTTTTVANAPTGSPTTTVAPRSLPATGSDITIGWLLTGMVCVLGGAVAVRLRHRLR